MGTFLTTILRIVRGGIDSSAIVALVVSTGMTAAVATPMAVAAVDARNEPAAVEEVISTDDDRFPAPVVFDDSELAVVLPTAAPAPTTEPADPTAPPSPTASPTEVVLSPDFPPLPTPAPTDVPADPTAVPPTQGPPTQGPPTQGPATVTPQTPTLQPTLTPTPTDVPATPTPVQPTMPPIQTATPEPTPTRHPNVTPSPTPTPSVPTPTSTATPTPTAVPPTPTATPSPTTPPRTPLPTPTTVPSTPTPSPQPPPPTPTSSPDPELTNLGVALNGSGIFTAGQSASVTIAVTNTGTANGRDVNVALNAGQGAISDVRGAGWFCSPQAPGSWNCFRNTLPVGTTLLTMSMVPHAEGSVTVTASISGSGTDSSPGNNSGAWAFPVNAGEGPI